MNNIQSSRDTGTGGFTLIEILIAIVILSFVALSIAGLFSHSMVVNASGHDYALLSTEARFALESLMSLPFEHAALEATTSGPASWTPVDPGFTIAYSVDDFVITDWTNLSAGTWTPAVGGNGNIKRITMTVASTNQILEGKRILTVSSLKIPG